jgi:hypothetical protein
MAARRSRVLRGIARGLEEILGEAILAGVVCGVVVLVLYGLRTHPVITVATIGGTLTAGGGIIWRHAIRAGEANPRRFVLLTLAIAAAIFATYWLAYCSCL